MKMVGKIQDSKKSTSISMLSPPQLALVPWPVSIAMAQMMKTIILTMVVLYFGYIFFLAGLTTDEKKRMAVVLIEKRRVHVVNHGDSVVF